MWETLAAINLLFGDGLYQEKKTRKNVMLGDGSLLDLPHY
jgi:hypothetical protein